MKAELLAIGSELLGPLRAETNSLWHTERLLDAGIEVSARATLADDAALLESAFRVALARADVVIATGGLGPTADDLTREALAAATSRSLKRDEAIVAGLRARFARYARPMSDTNLQQADVIDGAEVLPNARGSAPGQLLEHAERVAVLLPGPPGEMKPMFDEQVLPRLRARVGATRVVRRRVLRIAGMSESGVDEVAAASASRVRSSAVGPRPPVATTTSARASAVRNADSSSDGSSASVARALTSMPASSSRSVSQSELVSARSGPSSSLPIA